MPSEKNPERKFAEATEDLLRSGIPIRSITPTVSQNNVVNNYAPVNGSLSNNPSNHASVGNSTSTGDKEPKSFIKAVLASIAAAGLVLLLFP
jgi:hypothetical protein